MQHRSMLLTPLSCAVSFLLLIACTPPSHGADSLLPMLPPNSATSHHHIIDDQTQALLLFKHGISEDPLGFIASWSIVSHPCDPSPTSSFSHPAPATLTAWAGISCHAQHVVSVNLRSFRLSGSISSSLSLLPWLSLLDLSHNHFSGQIPANLFDGSHFASRLHYLNLSLNFLEGQLPLTIGNLSALTHLDLSYNEDLEGPLPAGIWHLPRLQVLTIGRVIDPFHTPLIGSLPETFGFCSTITHLEIVSVNLTGQIPPSLGSCRGLQSLQLVFCNLHGDIPAALQNLTHLQVLSFLGNFITGVIPPWIFRLFSLLNHLDLSGNHLEGPIPHQLIAGLSSKLWFLNLAVNKLQGEIPASLGNCSALLFLDLSHNELAGPISPTLGQLLALKYRLDLSNNNLTGEIPKELGNLVNLTVLDLSNNGLTGEIPKELGNLGNLGEVYLSNNGLTGEIPKELGNLGNLEGLDLSNNSLTGEIPKELGNLVNLEELDLSKNRLVGQIPTTLQNCTGLFILRLFGNYLRGGVAELDICRMEKLMTFAVQGNLLVGDLPNFTNSTSNLQVLDLRDNNFSGEIPTRIGNPQALSGLQVLSIASNRITGAIPDWVCDLPNLQLLDLSNNLLTGHIPHDLSHLKHLMEVQSPMMYGANTLYEEVHLTLKNSPQDLPYIVNSRNFIDLSANALEGSIPESFGKLIGLVYLNLSHNHFTGIIPSSLTNVSHLESLDVSHNKLSGGIPEGLGSLSSLSTFDVSSNQLQGQIPTLNNFYTRFNISSFENNTGLCGSPMSKKCNITPMTQGRESTSSSKGSSFKKWLSDYISLEGLFLAYPIGIIVGSFVACPAFKSFMFKAMLFLYRRPHP